MILSSLFVIFVFGFDQPKPPTGCVIDRCDKEVCVVETPEGWVEVDKKHDYFEGKEITCPLWLVEPT